MLKALLGIERKAFIYIPCSKIVNFFLKKHGFTLEHKIQMLTMLHEKPVLHMKF